VKAVYLSLILILNFAFGCVYGQTITSVQELDKARHQYKPMIINSTIPIVDYGYLDGQYTGPQLNPITIAQSAINNYRNIQESNFTNETEMINLIIKADWLLGHAKLKGNYSILEYNFDFPPTKMKAPWISAMAQAQAIQALINAHNLTKDDRYLNLSEYLLNAFYVEVKDGGITYKDNNGWWYEEYASPSNLNERRVLNGMGFTLLGLHDYYEYTNSSKAKFLFEKGLESFINNLPRYENSTYSLYDLSGKPADKFYHSIHLEIFDKLYTITKDPVFHEYFERWKGKLQ
jgi:hypothetical protein